MSAARTGAPPYPRDAPAWQLHQTRTRRRRLSGHPPHCSHTPAMPVSESQRSAPGQRLTSCIWTMRAGFAQCSEDRRVQVLYSLPRADGEYARGLTRRARATAVHLTEKSGAVPLLVINDAAARTRPGNNPHPALQPSSALSSGLFAARPAQSPSGTGGAPRRLGCRPEFPAGILDGGSGRGRPWPVRLRSSAAPGLHAFGRAVPIPAPPPLVRETSLII
jgi:hypothetical protein